MTHFALALRFEEVHRKRTRIRTMISRFANTTVYALAAIGCIPVAKTQDRPWSQAREEARFE